MSLPSLNSQGTVYGSCPYSDNDSIVSHQTYTTVKSDSSNFFSGDSDTDTLVKYCCNLRVKQQTISAKSLNRR
jgi:hypothetical protein